jgi:hypothetical protein
VVGVVPDPDGPGQRAKLVTAPGGFAAVIGESVELADLPASLPAAQQALAAWEQTLRFWLTQFGNAKPWHASCTCIHRRCATGSPSSASCAAQTSTTREPAPR